ncbi:MAG: diguanylate cyclase [Phycisphaerae bacterium]|nr:diguanylate cyclase [Phycisphaerae bacterium]
MNKSSSKQKYYVICVDDDADFLASLAGPLRRALGRLGGEIRCDCEFVDSAASALVLCRRIAAQGDECALIITDQRMPDTSGLELLEQLREIFPHAARVLLTGYAGLDSARLAINKHLLDRYISKPISDLTEFSTSIVGLVNEFHLQRLTRRQQQDLQKQIGLLQQANDRVTRLKRAAEQVAYFTQGLGTLDLQEILQLMVNNVPRLFEAAHALLVELDDDGKLRLLRRLGHSCRDSLACAQVLPQLLVDLFESNRPCLIRHLPADTTAGVQDQRALQIIIPIDTSACQSEPSFAQAGLSGAAPMRNAGLLRPTLLCLCCPQEDNQLQQTEEIEYKAGLLRDIIKTNLTHAAAYAESQRLSRYDSMTGLFVRRVLEDRLVQACQESDRYGCPLSMAMMDLDNFKEVNDTYGHLSGDYVLEEVGQLIRKNLRSCDIAARYGGDEFAVLLPGTSGHGAQRLVERFRRKVAQHIFAYEHLKITVSIGVATYDPQIDQSPLSLVHRADEAMYQAKSVGRNAIKWAGNSRAQLHDKHVAEA